MKKGYFLVEIMVSLAIFTLITVSTVGALLALIDANIKSQGLKSVMDNLNVAVENMSRGIRLGSSYTCDGTTGQPISLCNGSPAGISFIPQDASAASCPSDPTNRTFYYLRGTTIYRWRCLIETALTAPEVNVTGLQFYLYGAGSNDGQPRVFISINGKAGLAAITSAQTLFSVQTSVSQRQPDCHELIPIPASCQ
jgi:type II secretory pathway pseudopilin PulG